MMAGSEAFDHNPLELHDDYMFNRSTTVLLQLVMYLSPAEDSNSNDNDNDNDNDNHTPDTTTPTLSVPLVSALAGGGMDNVDEPLVSALAGGGESAPSTNTDEPLVSALAGGGESDSNTNHEDGHFVLRLTGGGESASSSEDESSEEEDAVSDIEVTETFDEVTFGVGDESHQIYTNMSGIIITWNTCAEDTFKVFRDELADMFGVDPQAFYIAHYAKYIRDEFRARDLPNGAWVSINCRLRGGGKRARGAKKKDDQEDKTKEDVIEGIEKEFMSQEFPRKELSKDVPIASIIGYIEGTLKVIQTDETYMLVLFKSMSRELLVKIQTAMDSHNMALKYNTVTNLLFKNEFTELKKHEDMIILVKERLRILTKYMLVKGFGNEFGDVQWSIARIRIEDMKSEQDKQQGRIEALAQQRAAEQRAREAFAGLNSTAVTPDAAVVSAPENPMEL
jgi:hypothetical protein